MTRWVSLAIVILSTAAFLGGGPAKVTAPEKFPDQSDPKAAAYSMALAIADGDQKMVDRLYVGNLDGEKEVLRKLVRARAASRTVNEELTKRFGHGIELGNENMEFNKVPLSAWIATANVKVKDNTAELDWKVALMKVELEKRDGIWFVKRFPIGSSMMMAKVLPMLDALSDVSEQFAQAVKDGKYAKLYEADAGFQELLAKRMKAVLQKDYGAETKEGGKAQP